MLLIILVTASVVSAGIAAVYGIIGVSIVADLLDDHELRTGYRQEGMFNAGLSFSGKAVTGVGIVLGGLMISLIQIPIGVAPSDVSEEVIFRLGLVVGVLIPLLYIIPISLIPRYKLTRNVVFDIQAKLAAQRKIHGKMEVDSYSLRELKRSGRTPRETGILTPHSFSLRAVHRLICGPININRYLLRPQPSWRPSWTSVPQ